MKTEDTGATRGRRDFLRNAGRLAAGTMAAHATAAAATAADCPLPAAARDAGLWISWYDLPETGRDQYLSWLHGSYLPALLKRPGYRWAAHYRANERQDSPAIQHTRDPIGAGYHYILLIGADDTHVFGNPTPSALHAALPAEDRRFLALRTGERVNIAVECGRVNGTALASYQDGALPAAAIQIGSFNCPLELEEELQAGYVQSRLPAMAATPSNVRNRNLKSVAGWAKHIILYEFTTPELFKRDYEGTSGKAPLGTAGNNVVPRLVHAPNGPNSALRIWPPVGQAVAR